MPDDAEARRGFAARMGPAYAGRHGEEEVSLHLRLAREASPARPARVSVEAAPGGRLHVTVVGLDLFAEFALICGVLSAQGLDIESGEVHTSTPREEGGSTRPSRTRRRPRELSPDGLPSRIIVDEFWVAPRGGSAPAEPSRLEAQLEAEVNGLLSLAAQGRTDEARERLDRRLAERFARSGPPAGALQPLDIELDNGADPRWTRMEVRGRDTPGFLYALATALALRGVYVQEVEIGSVGTEARDRFLIGTREGRKIEDPQQVASLRAAVALIKQFAHLLPLAPDPALALRSFGQLVDRLLAETRQAHGLELLASPDGLRQLARLLGASTFLWEDFIRLQAEHLLPVLDSWRQRPLRGRDELVFELDRRLASASSFEEKRRALNEVKDEEMLVVDMRHLLDPGVDLVRFSSALTDLAEAVVDRALAACLERVEAEQGRPHDERGEPCSVAVLGLGKFGGREMGYASDIELVLVYSSAGRTAKTGKDAGVFFEEAVRELVSFITARQEGIFHVDLRLRPHGAKGPLASPLAAVREYYRPGGGVAPFERQALVKLRRIAGDVALGSEVERLRDAFVWGDEPWDRANALHLRDRQSRELVPPGRFHVKYSPGALVEVEYAVQYLQIEHGRALTVLRTPTTLEALDRLREAGVVSPDDRERLRAAYVFWREVADALRMVRGNARDLLLPEPGSDDIRLLARRLGYAGPNWEEAAAAFLADLARHRDAVSGFFTERFRS